MAPSRAPPQRPLTPSFLLSFSLVACLLFLFLSGPSLAKTDHAPSAVKEDAELGDLPAESDLICHTANPAECYPRVFQPTEEFQIVRDDQDLPPGLHVRLNIYTGVKEARLNVPGEEGGELDPALQGLPIERSVVVVEQEEPLVAEEKLGSEGSHSGQQPKIPSGAPAYDPVGKPKPPQGGAESPFVEAMDLFRKLGFERSDRTATLGSALEELRELSHDSYYGAMIVSDPEVVKALFCMMLEAGERGQQAAYVVAGALQNNPSAVKELASGWDALVHAACPGGNGHDAPALIDKLYSDFAPDGTSPDWVKARVAALNGILEDEKIRADFLARGGMRSLLAVLESAGVSAERSEREGHGIAGDDGWDGAARRAGLLALDRFLDEEMGATPGVWPRVEMLGGEECGKREGATGPGGEAGVEEEEKEGCWRFWAGRAMRDGRGPWSKELWERLGRVEAGGAERGVHVEL